jgi:hypothetical protein
MPPGTGPAPNGVFLIPPEGGEPVFVRAEQVQGALAAGYQPRPGDQLHVVDQEGEVGSVPVTAAGAALPIATPEAQEQAAHERALEQTYGGAGGTAAAGALGLARGLTVGGSDLLAKIAGADMEAIRDIREVNPGTSMAAEIGGAVLPAVFTGGVGAAGTIARLTPAGAAATFAKAAGGRSLIAQGAVEGFVHGAGMGVTELALSDEPVNAERILSELSSNAVYGTVGGAAGGAVARGFEKVLGRASKRMHAAAEAAEAADAPATSAGPVADDLVGLDKTALDNARDLELERVSGERLVRGEEFVEGVKHYQELLEETNHFVPITSGAKKGSRLSAVARRTRKARIALGTILDTPKEAAARPSQFRKPLAQLEQSLLDIQAEREAIEEGIAAAAAKKDAKPNAGAGRLKNLEMVDELLERTRAMQETVGELTTPLEKTVTPRLQAIKQAKDALSAPKERHREGFAEKVTKGALFGTVAGAAASIGISPWVSMPAAGVISEKLGGMLFGGAGKAAKKTGARLAKAIDGILASKALERSPVVTTKILQELRYSDQESKEVERSSKNATAFAKRAAELRSMTVPGPDGLPVMTPQARAKVARNLAPFAAFDPSLADQMETVAARKASFLASKLPQEPGIGLPIGPSRWEPGSLAMAAFARYAAAAEDPIGVLERAADGTMTPEDAEALQAVYPELFTAVQENIISRIGELRETLPYQKRLMLSILFGVPVEPAFDPAVLAILQRTYAMPTPVGPDPNQKQNADMSGLSEEPGTPSQERMK